jgi:hypothetical protein
VFAGARVIVASATAKMVASSVTYPLEVIRTNMHVQSMGRGLHSSTFKLSPGPFCH